MSEMKRRLRPATVVRKRARCDIGGALPGRDPILSDMETQGSRLFSVSAHPDNSRAPFVFGLGTYITPHSGCQDDRSKDVISCCRLPPRTVCMLLDYGSETRG